MNLSETCYTVQNCKIIKGTLNDFKVFIEYACRPEGAMPKYYITEYAANAWAVASWQNKEIIAFKCYSKKQANEKLVNIYIDQILNNNEISIYLRKEETKEYLQELVEE